MPSKKRKKNAMYSSLVPQVMVRPDYDGEWKRSYKIAREAIFSRTKDGKWAHLFAVDVADALVIDRFGGTPW